MAASLLVLVELGVLCLVATVFLVNRRFRLAEAIAVAITAVLAMISCFTQICFLIGQPALVFLFDPLAFSIALFYLARNRNTIHRLYRDLAGQYRSRIYSASIVLIVWGYLALLALLIPEGNYDSMRYNLARVLLFAQERTLFLTRITEYHQSVFPVGGDIIRYFILRFHTDYGVAIFNWLAYLSIAFAAYAIARHFACRQTAVTTMLIVASMPLLVYQSTGTKPDILSAAAAASCLLLAARLLLDRQPAAGGYLLLVLAFGISTKFTFLAFAIPFVAILGIALMTRYRTLVASIRTAASPGALLVVGISVVVLSQVWLLAFNHYQWGHYTGPPSFVHSHTHDDGFAGAGANLLRYLFQSAHLMTPIDVVAEAVGGWKVSALLEDGYHALSSLLIGEADSALGSRYAFSLGADKRWGDGENGAWFGPLGFVLVLPAIGYSLVKGGALLRSCALLFITYVIIISWKIVWMPWNGRFFAAAVCCAIAPIAFLLAQTTRPSTERMLCAVSILVLLYAAAFDQQKELVSSRVLMESTLHGKPLSGALARSIWATTHFGADRDYYARLYFGGDSVREIAELLPAGATVGILTAGASWVYPFLAARTDVRFIPLTIARSPTGMDPIEEEQLDYLLCINRRCQLDDRLPIEVVWSSADRRGSRAVELVKIQLPEQPSAK